MYLVVLWIPLISAGIAGLMGRLIGREGVRRATVILMGIT